MPKTSMKIRYGMSWMSWTCLLKLAAPFIADEFVYMCTKKKAPSGTTPVNWCSFRKRNVLLNLIAIYSGLSILPRMLEILKLNAPIGNYPTLAFYHSD